MWLAARTRAGVEPVVYYASWHSQGRSGESRERRGHSPDRTAGRISHTGTPETRQWEQGYDTHTNITHQHHTNITHTNTIQISHQHHTNITHQHYTNITHTTHKYHTLTRHKYHSHTTHKEMHTSYLTHTHSTHTCKQKVCLCLSRYVAVYLWVQNLHLTPIAASVIRDKAML